MNFLNSASSAAVLVFYLPVVCTHTDTEGKQREARVQNISKSSEKNTIFNEHPVLDIQYSLFEEFAAYYKESVGRNLEETRTRNIFISYFLVEQFNVPAKSFTLHCSSVLLVLCNVLSLAYFRDGYL